MEHNTAGRLENISILQQIILALSEPCVNTHAQVWQTGQIKFARKRVGKH